MKAKYFTGIFFLMVFLTSFKISYSQDDDKIYNYVCTSSTGENYYLDSLSVKISGDELEFWYKATNLPDKNLEFRLCQERIYLSTKQHIALYNFNLNHNFEISGERYPYGENNQDIGPGSVIESLYNYIFRNYLNK